MPKTSPHIGLHLTEDNELRNYKEVRLEQSGENAASNMMIIDKEIGRLKTQIIFSSSTPANQNEGDTWNEIIP